MPSRAPLVAAVTAVPGSGLCGSGICPCIPHAGEPIPSGGQAGKTCLQCKDVLPGGEPQAAVGANAGGGKGAAEMEVGSESCQGFVLSSARSSPCASG